MNNTKYLLFDALALLGVGGDKARELIGKLEAYAALIRQWNPVAGLVSTKDAERLDEHIIDSLSLVPLAQEYTGGTALLLDIGSGGGFPAIPVKAAMEDLRVVMLERSERKVGFLLKVIGDLGLQNIEACHAEFPPGMPGIRPGLRAPHAITARAVEKPHSLWHAIMDALPVGSVYLAQTRVPDNLDAARFHVERIQDEWTVRGLRRGELHVVKRIA